jgi:glutamate mutase epsilon subunit
MVLIQAAAKGKWWYGSSVGSTSRSTVVAIRRGVQSMTLCNMQSKNMVQAILYMACMKCTEQNVPAQVAQRLAELRTSLHDWQQITTLQRAPGLWLIA